MVRQLEVSERDPFTYRHSDGFQFWSMLGLHVSELYPVTFEVNEYDSGLIFRADFVLPDDVMEFEEEELLDFVEYYLVDRFGGDRFFIWHRRVPDED